MARSKEELAQMLRDIGDILSIQGADGYRVSSYFDAADIVVDADEKTLRENPESLGGIGSSLGGKIEEYWETGEIEKLEELKKDFGFDPSELTQVEGVGVKTALKFHEELGIETLDEMEQAAEDGRIRELDGFGPKSEENILHEIDMVKKGVNKRHDWDEVNDVMNMIGDRIAKSPLSPKFAPAGSFRRKSETIGDLDVLVAGEDAEDVFDLFDDWDMNDETLMRGDTKMSFRHHTIQIDVRVVDEDQFGAALQYFTGSREHNKAMRILAKQRGFKVNEYGVFERDSGEKVAGATEEGVYEAVGLPYPEPEERTEDWVYEHE